MKVTIAAGLYPPEIGGPATYAAMIEEELPPRGFDIDIVPYGWVRRYPKILRHTAYTWKLWRESKGTDAIYALDPVSVGLSSYLVSRLRRVPLLLRLGGDHAWEKSRVRFGVTLTLDEFYENKDKWPLRAKILAKLQTFVANKSEKVVVPSEYLKSIVEKWGIEGDKLKVIYSVLFPITVDATREELREHFEYTHPTIVSAGRLVPWKGFSTLIDVVNDLVQYFPEITLIIVGDGEDRRKLEAKVAKLKLSQHIWFTGSISKDALGATIKAADVFVLNTAYEGLSHQLIEVMDVGTPIVTTNSGGNPELITDAVNGFLVEFDNKQQLAEAIKRVVNHPESRDRIVQSARGRSKDFSKEKVLSEIAKLFKETSDEYKA